MFQSSLPVLDNPYSQRLRDILHSFRAQRSRYMKVTVPLPRWTFPRRQLGDDEDECKPFPPSPVSLLGYSSSRERHHLTSSVVLRSFFPQADRKELSLVQVLCHQKPQTHQV